MEAARGQPLVGIPMTAVHSGLEWG
jgi:hypothetical protein